MRRKARPTAEDADNAYLDLQQRKADDVLIEMLGPLNDQRRRKFIRRVHAMGIMEEEEALFDARYDRYQSWLDSQRGKLGFERDRPYHRNLQMQALQQKANLQARGTRQAQGILQAAEEIGEDEAEQIIQTHRDLFDNRHLRP